MSGFAFWRDWGGSLDDSAFASAWAALGCVAAEKVQGDGDVADAVERARVRAVPRGELRWRFPSAAIGAVPWFKTAEPATWAKHWKRLGTLRGVRLRVVGAPADEPLAPWFELLARAQPPPSSSSLVLQDLPWRPHLRWPLRVGAIGAQGAAAYAAAVREAPLVFTGTDPCDVLVHLGPAAELAAELQRGQRTNAQLLVVRERLGGDWGALDASLRSALLATSASGWVVLPEEAGPEEAAQFLAGLASQLSSGAWVDVALQGGRDPRARFGPIAGLTRALASYRVEEHGAGAGAGRGARGGDGQWLQRSAKRSAPPQAMPPEGAAPPTAGAEPPIAHAMPPGERGEPLGHDAPVEALPSPPTSERHLQQDSFVQEGEGWVPARGGFVAGAGARVDVFIGKPLPGRDQLADVFPLEKVPAGAELTVWLTEPDHLPNGVRGTLKLAPDGTAGPCELEFKPGAGARAFAGRLSVLHRGRVIQTAALRGAVRRREEPVDEAGAPRLHALIEVRTVAPVEEGNGFDCAFVLNHDPNGTPRAVALSKDHAWIADVTDAIQIGKEINDVLSPVAQSVAEYADGPDGKSGEKLLVQLARLGRLLHVKLVKEQLGAPENRPDIANAEFIQIVSTRTDAVVPFEFVYEGKAPAPDATVCKKWRAAVEEADADGTAQADQACATGCPRESGEVVCPLAFWGMQKVIERHTFSPELAQARGALFLQSEPKRESDTLRLGGAAVVGASVKVTAKAFQGLVAALKGSTGQPPETAKDWKAWPGAVRKAHPKLLVALPHTDRLGTDVTLELGKQVRGAVDIDASYIRPDAKEARPLVVLLGCDTACTGEDYGTIVCMTRAAGAAIVMATIATVFGDHAAVVARRIVETLLPPEPPEPPEPVRLGEVLRTVKRRALLDGMFLPLCIVAYGDADWKLTR